MPQKTVPLLPLPEGIATAESRSGAYKSIVAAALKNQLEPIKMDLSGVERKSLPLHPLFEAKIQNVAKRYKMTFAETFAGLTQAGLLLVQKERTQHVSTATGITPPFPNPRPEQIIFYQNIRASILASHIVLAEASTGVGKGRALIAAAFESAMEGRTPVVVAAPTLKVLGQLWTEAEALQADSVRQFMPDLSRIKACFFPGAAEFVDVPRLRDHLDQLRSENKDDKSVRDWLDAGGPMTQDVSPLVRAMGQAQVPLSYLMEDLRRHATEFPPEDFALSQTNGEEETQESLRAVRQEAARADVIFCTHAMLLRSHQGGWKAFPSPKVLLIDEAHQFEQEVAKIHSTRVSLYSLRRRLLGAGKAGSKAAKAAKAVQNLIMTLRNAKELNETGRSIRLSQEIRNTYPGRDVAAGLDFVCKSLNTERALKDVYNIENDKDAFRRAQKVFNDESRESIFLEFSPDRRFPSLLVGKDNLGGILGSLWKTVDSVVLCSATLYLPDEFGNKKCDYISNILALPFARLDTPTPVRAPWVTTAPVMHIPHERLVPLLARPADRTDEAAEKEWIARIGDQLSSIVSQARGGTMILTTSYRQSELIRERLLALGVSEERLVQQKPNVKFTMAEAEFVRKHRAGLRPILPALGVAWTGVDLRDPRMKPENDTLLTDLAIACAPLGLNRSSTMLARIERMSVNPIIKEALMMLRQGLGRIIRDEAMRNRNIWFLDGRIWMDWKGMKLFCMSVRRILEEYKNINIFE